MKTCTKCHQVKKLEDFRVQTANEDGRAYACKECMKKAKVVERPADWKKKTADISAYNKAWRAENREKVKSYEKKHKRTPEKERGKYVRLMMRLHGQDWKPRVLLTEEEKLIRKKEKSRKKHISRMARPESRRKEKARKSLKMALSRGKLEKLPCFVCGSSDVEGHHPDYDRPLDVVWLCQEHHRQVHAIMRE